MAALSAEEVDPDEARQLADEILRRPQYRIEEPNLLERAVDWVSDRVSALLGSFASSGGGTVVGYVLLTLALTAIAYLLWRFAPRRLVRGRSDTVEPSRELVRSRRRADWLRDAEAAESDGDWGRAVHARYHALTVGLADGREVPGDESATSGELRLAFAGSAAAEPARVVRFEQATDRYEQIWFGGRQAEPADSRAATDDDQAILGARR